MVFKDPLNFQELIKFSEILYNPAVPPSTPTTQLPFIPIKDYIKDMKKWRITTTKTSNDISFMSKRQRIRDMRNIVSALWGQIQLIDLMNVIKQNLDDRNKNISVPYQLNCFIIITYFYSWALLFLLLVEISNVIFHPQKKERNQ